MVRARWSSLLPLALTWGCMLAAAATDAELLLDFKANFRNGDIVLDTWTAGSIPCSGSWIGVFCSSSGRVIHL